jgi:hypothetical protein
MAFSHPRVAALAAALVLGALGCADTSRCDAALASVERARAEAAQRDAQLAWLRAQLAQFASDLIARNAADRDLLLARIAALEATNAALVQRLDRIAPPPPATAVATAPPPPPPPVVHVVPAPIFPPVPRRAAHPGEGDIPPTRGIDLSSPY